MVEKALSDEEKRALEKKAEEENPETVRDVTPEEQAAFKAMFPGRRGAEG